MKKRCHESLEYSNQMYSTPHERSSFRNHDLPALAEPEHSARGQLRGLAIARSVDENHIGTVFLEIDRGG